MSRAVGAAVAFALLLTACGEGPLGTDEANWCRAYVTPNQIALTAADMGIDVDQALTEANIAFDLEGAFTTNPLAPIEAFWEVMEEDDGYRAVCRALYAENA